MNFESSTMTNTVPVMVSPVALITRDRIIRARTCGLVSVFSSRVQCRSMPSWLTVKETNTPTTYSWIRDVTSARNAMIKMMASTARVTMPLLYASRSPRV